MGKSRRAVLKKGGIVASTVMIAGCSGQSNEGEGNDSSIGDGEGNSQDNETSGTEPRDELEFEYKDFMQRALINPSYVVEQVINEDELGDYLLNQLPIELENTKNVFNNLNDDGAAILNDNVEDRAPWSVFNVEPRDIAARARDLDNTITLLFNKSVDEIVDGVRSNNLEILDENDDYVKFAGDHTSERTRKWNDKDSIYVVGYVRDTEMGPAGVLTEEELRNTNRLNGSNKEVDQIASFHHELLDGGDREPITKNEKIGAFSDYLINRAEECDRTIIRFIDGSEGYVARETNFSFEETGFEYFANYFETFKQGDGFDPEPAGNGKGPLSDIWYVEDPDSD